MAGSGFSHRDGQRQSGLRQQPLVLLALVLLVSAAMASRLVRSGCSHMTRKPLRPVPTTSGANSTGALDPIQKPEIKRNMSDASYDVIIIGAGVIGNSCALQLNRKGYRTLNIDKGPAAGSGSTSYSSGNLRSMC